MLASGGFVHRTAHLMEDKELKLSICKCIEQIDVPHLRSLIRKEWMKNKPSDQTSVLCCDICRTEAQRHAKKKSFFTELWHSKSKKSSPSGVSESKMEDFLMCANCAVCFCVDHAKEHGNLSITDDHHQGKHKFFLGVSRCVDTHANPLTLEYCESLTSRSCTNDDPLALKGAATTVDSIKGSPRNSQPNKYALRAWCTICGEVPEVLSSTVDLNATPGDTDMSESVENGLPMRIDYWLQRCHLLKEEDINPKHPAAHMQSRPSAQNFVVPAKQSGEKGGHITSVSTSTHYISRHPRKIQEDMLRGHVAGIENVRSTCYFNSVLQCVLQCKFFTQPLVKLPETSFVGPLTHSLQVMIRHLQRENAEDLERNAMYSYARKVLGQLCKLSSIYSEDEQQDCQELYLTLINGVADEFDKGKTNEEKERDPRISFEGTLSTQVECETCQNCLSRSEMFMSLSVPVESSIQNGLIKLFCPMHLNGKDQYACENCFSRLSQDEQEIHNANVKAENEKKAKLKKKNSQEEKKSLNCVYTNAEVRTTISRLGGSLALHLLRFHRDGRGIQKILKAVEFPLQLNLGDYVSEEVKREYQRVHHISDLRFQFPNVSQDKLTKILDESNDDFSKAQQMVRELTQNAPMKFAEEEAQQRQHDRDDHHYDCNNKSKNNCNNYEDVVSDALVDDATLMKEVVPSLDRQLVGIVTHRGSLHGGHYVAYVRNMNFPQMWFRCDDEDVEVVSVSTVLACKTEVYMLFYE